MTMKTVEESSVRPTGGISRTNVQNILETNEISRSILQVKVEQYKKYSCRVCGLSTKKKSKYKDHVEFHQKDGQLFCSLCDFFTLSSKRLKKHLRSHENDSCDDNNNHSFTNNTRFSKMSLIGQETLSDASSSFLNSHYVPLKVCDEEAFDESAAVLQLSEKDVKKLMPKNNKNFIENSDEKKMHYCSICSYKTNRRSHLTRHDRVHTGERPFSCTYNKCNYSSSQNNLITHYLAKHSKEKPYLCKLCGEAFEGKHRLNSHVLNHRGKRPYCCLYNGCEYSSTTSRDLEKHIRTHTGYKPHHCYFKGCGYSCTSISPLNAHIRTHTGERPYACHFKGCNYSASTTRTLENHILMHTGAKPFHCDFNDCKFSTARSGILKVHMLRHLTQNPHACPQCKFRSCTSLEIEQHLKTHHKLQNTSPNSGYLHLNDPTRETSAQSATDILRVQVQAQPSFNSQNNNEIYSETPAKVSRNYLCASCNFESKSKKTFKAHLDFHGHERKSSTPKVSVTSHDAVTGSNENYSQAQSSVQIVSKSAKVAESPDNATEIDLRRHKTIKTKHHLKSHAEFRQVSSTQIQPSLLFEPPDTTCNLNHSRRRKTSLENPGSQKEEESSSGVKVIEAISPNNDQLCVVVNTDLPQSVSPVKAKPLKKFSCPICEFGTKKKRKYKDHVELHRKAGYLFCSLCDFASVNSKRFKKHLRAHKNGPFDDKTSEIQKSSFSKMPLISQETLSNTSSSFLNLYSLPFSDEVPVVKLTVAIQPPENNSKLLKMKKKETLSTKKCFCCSFCDYKTQFKYRLTDHIRTHTGDKPFWCTYSGCNYTSALKCNLMTHLVVRHSDEKPFSCQLCGVAFKTKHLLNSHAINHTGRRPHQCLYKGCEYSSSTSSDLKKHIRTHTKEKPYHCYFEGCGYSCSMSCHLKLHILTHTGERPYPCNFKGCNLSFRQTRHLKDHILTHTGAKAFHCNFNDCKFLCARSDSLKVHMLRHLTENPHTCPKCKFRSRTLLEIEQHLETFHKLQNASPSRGQPDAQVKESPAEAITNILRVRAQPSFSFQNNNERDSEALDVARPSKKYICTRCGLESKIKKKHKAHIESHVEKRKLSETKGTKLTKLKRILKQGSDSLNRSQTRENSTALLRESKKSLAPFSCNFCKKSFAKEMKLLNHLRYHTGQKMPGV